MSSLLHDTERGGRAAPRLHVGEHDGAPKYQRTCTLPTQLQYLGASPSASAAGGYHGAKDGRLHHHAHHPSEKGRDAVHYHHDTTRGGGAGQSQTVLTLSVLRCRVSNGAHKWFVCIVPPGMKPGTDHDIDFYKVREK